MCGARHLRQSGVPCLIRLYLRKLAPLETQREESKRGHGWRDKRYAGIDLTSSWTELLTRTYEPVICGVLRHKDDNICSLWEAANAIERMRIANQGSYTKLVKSSFFKPFTQIPAREPYLKRIREIRFIADALAKLAPTQPPTQPAASEQITEATAEAAVKVSALTLPLVAIEGANSRIIGIDPSLSSGVCVLQLTSAGEVLALDVRVLDVRSLASDGARCYNLRRFLLPLLSPAPAAVYIESFYGHGRQGDAISYKLRGVIESLLFEFNIVCREVAPQTWKKIAVGDGVADKKKVQNEIERRLGFTFPSHMLISGSLKNFRDDASDATGIALFALQELYGKVVVAPSLTISSPGVCFAPRLQPIQQPAPPPPAASQSPPPQLSEPAPSAKRQRLPNCSISTHPPI